MTITTNANKQLFICDLELTNFSIVRIDAFFFI